MFSYNGEKKKTYFKLFSENHIKPNVMECNYKIFLPLLVQQNNIPYNKKIGNKKTV